MPELRNIPLSLIDEPPAPVRATMEEGALYELRDSIRAMGLLQPIIVVPTISADGAANPEHRPAEGVTQDSGSLRYEIVAGHRRFLAARLVPMEAMPCMVFADGELAKEAAMLHENAFREDMTAAEEGWFYCELVEKHTLTEAALCAMVRQKPDYIYERMDLVRKDANIAQLVAQRKMNFSVAKELLKCPDPDHRKYLAHLCVEGGATAKVARGYVQQWQSQQQGTITPQPGPAAPDAGSPPVENTMKCWCCGKGDDPQNLRLLYLHWYELDSLQRILQEAGLRPGQAPAQPVAG